MADPIAQATGADLPLIPNLGGIKKSSDALSVMQQGLTAESKRQTALAEANRQLEEAQLKANKEAEDARAASYKKSREIEDAKELELRRKLLPNPEFHPVQENMQSLGALFSLIATAGIMVGGSGKLSAQRAMDAMTGVMQGWQKGREDQFRQAKDTFDREVARVKSLNDQILSELKEAQAKFVVDREEAARHADMAARLAGQTGVIGAKAKVGDIQGAISVAEGAQRAISEVYKNLAQMEKDAFDRAYSRETALMVAGVRSEAARKLKADKDTAPLIDGIVGIENLQRELSDPEVRVGLKAKLAPLAEKLNSLTASDSGDAWYRTVSSELTGTDKTTVFLKDALLASYEIARAAKGGRLTVQDMRVDFPVLDPTNYTPEAYNRILDDQRRKFYGKLQRPPYNYTVETIQEATAETPYTPYEAPKPSKPMPTGDKIKAYADAHFNGDVTKATDYLKSQGYQ